MNIKRKDFLDFARSLDGKTKLLLHIGTPIILALLLCGTAVKIAMVKQGFSGQLDELYKDLFTCAAESFTAVYLPAFFIELFSGKYR